MKLKLYQKSLITYWWGRLILSISILIFIYIMFTDNRIVTILTVGSMFVFFGYLLVSSFIYPDKLSEEICECVAYEVIKDE